jgi:hypothetical protein
MQLPCSGDHIIQQEERLQAPEERVGGQLYYADSRGNRIPSSAETADHYLSKELIRAITILKRSYSGNLTILLFVIYYYKNIML